MNNASSIDLVHKLDKFTQAYLECCLWAESDESDESGGDPLENNYVFDDFAPESLQLAIDDCKRFQEENADDIANANYDHDEFSDAEMAGHDFWLTRNGHGAGFWDRELGDVGDRLTEAAKGYGECCVYVSDDGQLCFM